MASLRHVRFDRPPRSSASWWGPAGSEEGERDGSRKRGRFGKGLTDRKLAVKVGWPRGWLILEKGRAAMRVAVR